MSRVADQRIAASPHASNGRMADPFAEPTPPPVVGVRQELMFVTPQMAQRWLDSNHRNRKHTPGLSERYADDMRNGRWVLTHQGIAFDVNGNLRDGQHRLTAIIMSKVRGVWMWVAFGLEPDSIFQIDGIKQRRAEDQITISGELGVVTRHHMAVLRKMVSGLSHVKPRSLAAEKELLRLHFDAVTFAISTRGGKRIQGLLDAPMIAAIGRAYYSANHEQLRRFAQVIKDGMALRHDEGVIVATVRRLQSIGTRGGSSVQTLRYAVTTRGLYAYLKGESLTRVGPASSELFPLPEEINA